MADLKKENFDKSQFEFVQADKKLYDKKLETKPVGYFRDAMSRFAKNKTNLIASSILLIVLLLAILVPILSPKNSDALEERLSFLPPRIPLLENIGIADGTKELVDQPIDPNLYDSATGLYLPSTISQEFIIMDTLENYYKECTDKDALCVGGVNELQIDTKTDRVAVRSSAWIGFSQALESTIEFEITKLENVDNSKVQVFVGPIAGEYILVGEFTEAGTYTIDPWELATELPPVFNAKLQIAFVSDNSLNTAQIQSIAVTASNPDLATHNFFADGYKLSQFQLTSEDSYAGNWVRAFGQRLLASFRYDKYSLVFGEREELAFSAVEYDQIIAENADICIKSPDPNNPKGWLFSEGCPIIRVIQKNESVWVHGVETFSYNLVLDYQLYKGYEEMPYFLFGTDQAGRDMVKLIFIGLRTSLLIGLIVAFINITIGIVYGAISGYYGGQVDIIMERFAEIVGRIPWLVTLSIFIALIGPGIETLIYVMVVSGWIGVASVTRTQFYRYKGREYVLASRTLGAKDGRLIFRHILPNGIGTIITSSILMVPALIFTEATLSYLGFGIGHGQSFTILGIDMSGVSIGVLLSDGRNQLRQNPHLTLFPSLIISILMITFNMFGNALRDAFNPALRGSE